MLEVPIITQENSQIIEEKKALPKPKISSYEYVIPESLNLIKKGSYNKLHLAEIYQGNYKRAFNMLDTYFGDPSKIGTVQKVQLCRRLMVVIVTLCTKSLNKPEIGNRERTMKLLEAGSSYLVHWHNGISNYITKTNKKFEHLNALLAELSDSSDDEIESDTPSMQDLTPRRSSFRDAARSHTQGPKSNLYNKNKADKQESLLIQILKSKEMPDATPTNMMDKSFSNATEGTILLTEELQGDEMNGICKILL